MKQETINEILVYINDQISEHNMVKEALNDNIDACFKMPDINTNTIFQEKIKELQTAHTKITFENEMLLKWKNSLPTDETVPETILPEKKETIKLYLTDCVQNIQDGLINYFAEIENYIKLSDTLEIDQEFYQILEINKNDDDETYALVREIMLDKNPPEKTENDTLKCPYCGYDYNNYHGESNNNYTCVHCNGKYEWEQIINIKFVMYPLAAPVVKKIKSIEDDTQEETTIKYAKYIKEHNNYDFILGETYPAIEYNDEWIMIDDQLYRRECFQLECFELLI